MKPDRVESRLIFMLAVLVVILGEVMLIQGFFLSGILLYSLYLESLLLYGAYRWETPQHQLLVLAIPAIIRLMNFTLPIGGLSPIFAQWIISVPLALTAVVYIWLLRYGKVKLTLETDRWWIYLGQIVMGAMAGALLFQFSGPGQVSETTLVLLLFQILVLVISMALLEEWLFRGIMQTALGNVFGNTFAIPAVALFYTLLHLGQGSLPFTVTIFLISLYLGWTRRSGENLMEVWLFHGAANIVFFLFLPM